MTRYGVFSGPYFPPFRLKMEIYSVNLRIQSECGKIRTRNSVFGHLSRYRVIKNISNKTNTNLYTFFKLFKFFSIVFRGIIFRGIISPCITRNSLNQAYNFIKKETMIKAFSCEFCEISKNTFFAEQLWTTTSTFHRFLYAKVVAWSSPIRNVFLKTWGNSLENTCVGVSF